MSGGWIDTYRAPPEVMLAKIQVFLAKAAATGAERTKIDIHLVIALLRFALTQGATTVGDLQMRTRPTEQVVRALEQAQACIRGETPEDCTPEEAREHTLDRIRHALTFCTAPNHAKRR
jgi:hypothetical protein